MRLVAVGDIMLGRGVGACHIDDYDSLLTPGVAQALTGDIVTGNLECVLGSSGTASLLSHSHFRGDVGKASQFLRRFTVLSIANNHVNDFGPEAIGETMAELDRLGIRHVGVGRTVEAASEPALLECKGQKVAIFAATTVSPLPPGSPYTAAIPGAMLFKALRKWKADNRICILHLHTGGGDFEHPAPFVIELMVKCAEAGFDLVLGHHPHVVQGHQTISQTQIYYSLGDFVFDKFENGRDTALIVTADFSGEPGAPPRFTSTPVCRAPSLELHLIDAKALEEFNRRIWKLSAMIEDGRSRQAFNTAFGNPLRHILRSTWKDFRSGGLQALWAKVRRIDGRRMSLLVEPLRDALVARWRKH